MRRVPFSWVFAASFVTMTTIAVVGFGWVIGLYFSLLLGGGALAMHFKMRD